MALSAATVWEVRTTGSDTNGGGFVTGASGTDYSQQDAAQYTATDLMVDATTNTKVTSTSHSFVAADVGNILQVTAGTGWTVGFYQIVSVASGAATLDRSPAAVGTTGGTYAVGGATASPALPVGAFVAGHIAYVKAGSYTISSGTANVSNGVINLSSDNDSVVTAIVGYNANRTINNMDGAVVTLTASGISSVTIVQASAAFGGVRIRNLAVNGASLTGITGFSGGSGSTIIENCKAQNCKTAGFSAVPLVRNCLASACGNGFATCTQNYGCVADSSTGTGFIIFGSQYLIDCIASNGAGTLTDGFLNESSNGGMFINCTAYGNTGNGFNITSFLRATMLQNCLAVNNSRFGFTVVSAVAGVITYNCGHYNNTSGGMSVSYTGQDTGTITLTANPFTNSAGGDFSLNSTAGGGAACRAAGFPGAFSNGTTTGYLDIGAVQHQDSGGGGSTQKAYTF